MIDSVTPIEDANTVAEEPARSVGPLRRFWQRSWPEITSIVVGILLWELLGRVLDFPFFPPFSDVLAAWLEILGTGKLIPELLNSLQSLFIGYSLAVVLGLTVGALMGRYRKVEYFFNPFIDINLSTPTLVYIPVLFALFGVGDGTRITIVFMYSFFIIVVNTVAGIKQVDPSLVEMGYSFGASEGQLFRKIRVWDALPLIMAGIRIGMSRGVKGMINGELFIALVGLGARLRYYSGSFNIEKVLAVLLTVIVVAAVLTSIVQYFDRRLTSWAETAQLS